MVCWLTLLPRVEVRVGLVLHGSAYVLGTSIAAVGPGQHCLTR